ncbi:cytochrome P450 [Xylaria bambusicola]|uniref:cytochrome P450 n=1 Tax=Xylaria bambusicola TaxID=326684 RepID=UPI002007F9C1|nr:cytochrome P450 [Xylaria bambusicola]KAI0509558.1 cytochrome P450 [Xylaria bambusicola]
MPMQELTHTPLGPVLLGVLSHVTVFIRGEWHMRVPVLITAYSCLITAMLGVDYSISSSFTSSVKTVGRGVGLYAIGLFGSIIIYRRYFHRLKDFPGPSLAAVTKLWHVWRSADGKNHLLLERLFSRYGPIVRTGPEELTIIDAAIPHIIDGVKSQFRKATFYDVVLPMVAISATRNVGDHDARRRIWNRGFSSKALAEYDGLLLRYTELLASQIECLLSADANSREAIINVTDWFAWYAFDVMGEFAFSKSFNMLQNGEWHSKVRLLVDGMNACGTLGKVPWLVQLGKFIRPRASLVKNWDSMLQWCRDCMHERLQIKDERADLSQWLINAYIEDGSQQAELAWLQGDAVTMIVAGSGTVSVVLTFAFYQLARDHSQQQMLYNEVKDFNIYDGSKLQECVQLTVFINETLRMYPPVPTAGNKVTPPQGVTINTTYIPGGVTIVAPKYSIHRLESSYESADQFIPERWTTQSDMVKDNRGYAPFSQGKYGCVGKQFAMTEMRLVISLLLKKFEIGFQADDKGETLFIDLKDNFTFAPGDLHLKFRLRNI